MSKVTITFDQPKAKKVKQEVLFEKEAQELIGKYFSISNAEIGYFRRAFKERGKRFLTLEFVSVETGVHSQYDSYRKNEPFIDNRFLYKSIPYNDFIDRKEHFKEVSKEDYDKVISFIYSAARVIQDYLRSL